MVGFVWLLETGITVFTWMLLYSYTVTNFGQPNVALGTSWSMAFSPVLSASVTSIVQIFFAYRIRVLSASLIIPIIGWCAAAMRLGTATAIATLTFLSPNVGEFNMRYSWLMTTHMVVSVVVDVTSTASLYYYLLRRRTVFKQTRRLVHKIVLYTAETGSATALDTDDSRSNGDIWSAPGTLTRPDSVCFKTSDFQADIRRCSAQQELGGITVDLEDKALDQLSTLKFSSPSCSVYASAEKPQGN
ncbi:hypothetical protein JB92DRAFT_2956253 [Gautieria morchelliformis]|nr:hypothetical protein JB92DRAFT_2956253 [Gautieria morchelliformis]